MRTFRTFSRLRATALLLALSALPALAGIRTWTDVRGRQMQAILLGVQDGQAHFERDGHTFRFPVSSLSEADRQYIARQQLLSRRGPANPASPGPAAQVAAAAAPSAAAAPANLPDSVLAYSFPRTAPRFMTTMVFITNPRKLRPILLYGRGERGSLRADPDNTARNQADFSVLADRYDTAAVDTDRMAAGTWVARERGDRPSVRVRVREISGVERREEGRDRRRYRASFRGELEADGRTVPFTSEGTLRFTDAGRVQGHRASARVYLSTSFTVRGQDLGLAGEDAGDLEFEVWMIGYTGMEDRD